jgi:hypothetical protein
VKKSTCDFSGFEETLFLEFITRVKGLEVAKGNQNMKREDE